MTDTLRYVQLRPCIFSHHRVHKLYGAQHLSFLVEAVQVPHVCAFHASPRQRPWQLYRAGPFDLVVSSADTLLCSPCATSLFLLSRACASIWVLIK